MRKDPPERLRCAWDAPVGVFDSGVGGLTVLRALVAELPRERFVYLGDTARLPYGTKSPETVVRYALQAVDALAGYGLKCLVLACNTASAVAVAAVSDRIRDVPVIGVIEPGAQAACQASRSGHIAVIATEGTVRGGAYQDAIIRRRRDARVSAVPAQLLVALAEEGLCDGPIAESVVRHYLEPLFDSRASASGPDTLVLGCTHFPMLADPIRAVVGPEVRIVDSAETTARHVRGILEAESLVAESGEGSLRLLATDAADRFARIGGRFLERPIRPHEVELVDL